MPTFLTQQWKVVVDAPLPFGACIIAAIAVIWVLVNWHYLRQIETLKDHVSLFKDKVPVLEKELETLRRQIMSREPYDKLEDTTASAAIALAALSSQGGWKEFLVPVRNSPRKP